MTAARLSVELTDTILPRCEHNKKCQQWKRTVLPTISSTVVGLITLATEEPNVATTQSSSRSVP